MGIRSDVGLTIHADYVDEFLKNLPEGWEDIGLNFKTEYDGHHLYVFNNTKWSDTYSYIRRFLEHLRKLPLEAYYLVEACFDYPNSENVEGEFVDNPFDLQSEVYVKLYYCDPIPW